ncbi:hypothetical protein M8J76_005535 [Diaphorina citri]|nr:hypothetical protein M8J76_005535 [Diaphorina citri]
MNDEEMIFVYHDSYQSYLFAPKLFSAFVVVCTGVSSREDTPAHTTLKPKFCFSARYIPANVLARGHSGAKRMQNTSNTFPDKAVIGNSSRYPLIPPRSRLEAVYSARAKPRKFAPGIHRAYTLLPTAGDNHSGAKTQTKLVNIVIVENGGSL